MSGSLGIISKVAQSGSKSIAKTTWTNILSLTLSAGTYIIVGQLNIIGSTDTSKYIAITDSSMAAINAINFSTKQLYSQVTTILTVTSTQTIAVSAYSNEVATVSNGNLSAIKIK